MSIGDYSYGTPLLIYDPGDTQARIAIGKFCSFAEGVKIFIGRHGRHYYDFLSTYPIGMVFGAPSQIDRSVTDSSDLGVTIGSDVWIGRDAAVMAGVKIGHGAVIGASSLVTKDVKPYTIVGGVPARTLKQRFSDSQIERLLSIAWWNWEEERLRRNVDLFYRGDVDDVMTELETAFGREVIAEMNRAGMMVDLSHAAKGVNMEAMRLSQAPVIASRSGVRALADTGRNLDDEQLLALKKNGGVIQVGGFGSNIKTDTKERTHALAKLREEFGLKPQAGDAGDGAMANLERPRPVESSGNSAAQGGGARGGRGVVGNAGLDALSPGRREEYNKRVAEIDATMPPACRANVKDLVNHIDYAVKFIGIDHVDISPDFGGGGCGIDGGDRAAEAFDITLELVRRGYSEAQIGKLWSGNLLRAWGDVQEVSQRLRKEND